MTLITILILIIPNAFTYNFTQPSLQFMIILYHIFIPTSGWVDTRRPLKKSVYVNTNLLRERWSFGHLVHLQNITTMVTVKIMPAYLIHLSKRFRLSMSLNTEFDSPKVLRTSSAFLWALCTKPETHKFRRTNILSP